MLFFFLFCGKDIYEFKIKERREESKKVDKRKNRMTKEAPNSQFLPLLGKKIKALGTKIKKI